MKCLRCNNEINDNSKFCEYCGNRVESNINMTSNQTYNYIPNQNNMINSNMNYSQTNNTNYNNSNVNASVSNNANNSNIDNTKMQNNVNLNISNNINNDFKTLEGATNLFRSVNCIGSQNIVFIAYRDLNSGPVVSKRGLFAGLFGGAIGGFANGVAEGADRKMKSIEMAKAIGIEAYDALLINVTENGLGIIPLLINGSKVLAKLDKFEPNINNFVFLNNSMIQNIVFDKYPLNGKAKTIKISINNDITLDLFANLEEQLVPYQKESMEKLINMYSKK